MNSPFLENLQIENLLGYDLQSKKKADFECDQIHKIRENSIFHLQLFDEANSENVDFFYVLIKRNYSINRISKPSYQMYIFEKIRVFI